MLRADVPVGQLSVGRPRQLARRSARPSRQGLEVPDLLAALRGRRVRRNGAPAGDGRVSRQRSPRGRRVPRRHRARVSRGDSAHRAADPAHGARAALPAVAARARCRHQGRADRRRAPTRCSPATTSSARRRCGGSGRGSRTRKRVRACSNGSIRTSSARRSRSARSCVSSSASGSPTRRSPGSATNRAGGAQRPSSVCFRPTSGRALRSANAVASLARRPAAGVRTVDAARAGPVPRSAHAALGLPAVVAGRPDADGQLGRRAVSVPRSPRRRAGRIAAASVQAARPRREARAQARRRGARSRGRSSSARSSRIARPTRCRSRATTRPRLDRRGGVAARARRGRRLHSARRRQR